ncbi:MAG TPA: tetratricopeptide repeat protein [Aestuariivirgaceae bacterium]|nr:tetratricopeptide repeat protein [Aestuariivirgaceae bacterium]
MSDDSLFREVDEEFRRDQALKLWQRYGNYVVGVALAVVLLVAAIKGWQYWQTYRAESAGAAYHLGLAHLEGDRTDEAQAILAELADDGQKGYSTLARLHLAGILADRGEVAEAVAAYDAVADSSAAREFRDLATIRAGYLLAGTESPEILKQRLAVLERPDSSWRNAVREILASAHYRSGNFVEADRLMNEILVDPEAPQAMRQRAQMMVQLLEPLLAAKAAAVN